MTLTAPASDPPTDSPQAGSLTPLVAPRSIAVIGASDQPARIGGRILARLKETYRGAVYPVNSRRSTVQGLAAHPDIGAVPEPVDLAIVVAPGAEVPGIARAAADRGARSLLVLSAGFGEAGEEGRRAQEELAAIGADAGMRICGPNCIGIVNLTIGLRAVFSTIDGVPQKLGGTALVSQSGGFGMSMFEMAQSSGLGVSYMCATGNEADVSSGELVGHLAEQPDVEAIGLFLEGLRRPDLLLAGARRALELGKPVVAVRTGRSAVGMRAAASHTGALASADDVVSAAFDGVGILRVEGPRELVEQLRAFSAGRRPRGSRLAVVTSSGGAGVLMADVAEAAGLELPEPSPEPATRLGALVPSFGSVRNPIDPTAQIVNDQSMLQELFATVSAAPDYDMVCVSGVARGLGPGLRETIQRAAEATDKPFTAFASQPDVALDLTERGVPAFVDPNRMIRALGRLWAYERDRAVLLDAPPRTGAAPALRVEPPVSAALAEHVARRYVVAAGVPVPGERLVVDSESAVAAAEEIGRPVALKLSADWLTHKSEHGALRLGVVDSDAVRCAYRELEELATTLRPEGAPPAAVLVQEMAPPRGLEIVCAALRDPTFGPVVTVGLGGVLVEITRERRLALAPLDRSAARDLVGGLAGGRLVGHPRGLSEAEADRVADVVVGLGGLLATDHELQEIEINPLVVADGAVVAVDALAAVSTTGAATTAEATPC
ncbi:acetate--CoA ligase family protein [Pseudonocardia kunmingensis]|uniref:Acyl-CoA synthetase (NDP forming) n=1 Tax=Pseudonocardia kunmingensis TaxID=630975 RepID=A0A543DPR7_9PSEU|nr:acetate--CoA ligase family protein [Pseudonocardia kunmingensis]TQM11326.1 acyl-CoA synthetase (NDP forming) [Pseudonocardia kunmingensis]